MTDMTDELQQLTEEIANSRGDLDAFMKAAEHAREIDAFTKYGKAAREAHITFEGNHIPGFMAFSCDIDVHIGLYGKIAHAGRYFLNMEEDQQTALVYAAEVNPEQLQQIADNAKDYDEYTDKDGVPVKAIRDKVMIDVSVEPLEMAEGHYLTFIEMIAWLAITTAETPELKDAIFLSAYDVKVNKPDQGSEQETAKLPTVASEIADNLIWPIDKVNGTVWKLMEGKTSGKIDIAHHDDRKPINEAARIPVTYSIDFSRLEGLTINRQLTPYDRRVYIAAAALFAGGYEIVTPQLIYRQMGYAGDAGASDKRKISDSITKLSKAWITIDNIREHERYDGRGHFKYHGPLLPMEYMEAVVNGNVVETAVHILKEPALITYATLTKQITTVAVKWLESPLNRTEANIDLEDYLIYRIARITKKGSRMSNKIRFETIYEHAGIKTAMQRKRALPKIKKLLEHYKNEGLINGYSIVSDGIEIFYGNKK